MEEPYGSLIPGLTDDIAALILTAIPYAHQSRLRATSRSWDAFLSPRRLYPLRRRLRLPARHLLCVFPNDPAVSTPYLFDPAASAWSPLPHLPTTPQSYDLSNFIPVAAWPHLYLLGGSHFDARSYPINQPSPSAAAYRLDLSSPAPALPALSWSRIPDMLSPRGSFACAAFSDGKGIIVAGGGSRHAMYPSEGTRTSSVETFDAVAGVWKVGNGLPRYRSGCVGFLVPPQSGREEEFWVMGGYGDYSTLSGIFPTSVYYRNAVAFGMSSGKWREVGDMWADGERERLGLVAVVDGEDGHEPGIYMLEGNTIFRYEFASNRWWKESNLQKKIPVQVARGFVAMNGELYVLSPIFPNPDPLGPRRSPKLRWILGIQVYNPEKKKWRSLEKKPPFRPINFTRAVFCTIRL